MRIRRTLDRSYATPDSANEISRIAQSLLVHGQCVDVLPTPLDRLFEIARVEEHRLPAPEERGFLYRFESGTQTAFRTLIQKIRGAADLRRRVVYIAPNDSQRRTHFVRGHELGHQVLEWHRINGGYVDHDATLRPAARAIFEGEANFFSSEIIFQGNHFVPRARDLRPSFPSVFELANLHGASNHATFWRFVLGQDEPVAGLIFYPTDMWDQRTGRSHFRLWKVVRSPAFEKRFRTMLLDDTLSGDHPWLDGLSHRLAEGMLTIHFEGARSTFLWESWWNNYALLVMLRKRPVLHFVGRILTSDNN